MGRRKKGRPVSGWLILDKPYDLGSTEAVSKLRWFATAQKAGHAGTLDPLATGLLPIAFGEATKTVPYVQDGLKTYRFTARWGEARPEEAAIREALSGFTGTILQRPPAFSAIKVQGERAYDLARDGEAVELAEREVEVYELRLLRADPDEAEFEAVTGKGTYVRSIVRDMAEALGTLGHVGSLRRTRVGPFGEEDMVSFEAVTGRPGDVRLAPEDRDEARFDAALIGTHEAFREEAQAIVDQGQVHRLTHGQEALLSPQDAKAVRGDEAGEIEPVLATHGGEAIAICRLDGLKLRPIKVLATN